MTQYSPVRNRSNCSFCSNSLFRPVIQVAFHGLLFSSLSFTTIVCYPLVVVFLREDIYVIQGFLIDFQKSTPGKRCSF